MTTYTHEVDKEVLFGLMHQHVELSAKGNDLFMREAFAASDAEVQEIKAEHLDVSYEITLVAFEIADMLLTDELRSEFMDLARAKAEA